MSSKKRGWVIDEETIQEAESSNNFNGCYEVVIKEAITDFYPSGAEYIQLKVEIPARTDYEGNPKQYRMERQVITAGDAKGNAPTFYMGIFQSAFKILGVTNKVAKAEAVVWDSDEKAFIPSKVDQYVELLDKKIGAIIKMKQEFPTKVINGYTKEALDFSDLKDNPYAVRIPDYYNESGELNNTFPRFTIERFYSLSEQNYGKTASEIISGKPATIVKKRCEELKSKNSESKIMDDIEMNQYILTQLQKRLKKFGEEFDEKAWIPYGSASSEETDIPF